MRKMAGILATAMLMGTPTTAQVTRIETNDPAPVRGDPDRIVCEVDQTTGTRLGARKVCKTVLEWQQMTREHRETVEQIQLLSTSACHDGRATCPAQ